MNVILVTGGNKGIGLEICRQLDEMGHIVIMGSRDPEKGKESAKSLSDNLVVMQLDVTDPKSIQDSFDFIKKQYGRLDVLINNAGLGPGHGMQQASGLREKINVLESKYRGMKKIKRVLVPLLRKSRLLSKKQKVSTVNLGTVKEIMETNLYGPWRMVQSFMPLLLKSNEGRIINISSGSGQLDNLAGDYHGYSLSKASLNALTIMLAGELKVKGISVNAMCPGWVKTDMGGPNATREVSQGADTAVWLATVKKIPTGKFFRDREIINW